VDARTAPVSAVAITVLQRRRLLASIISGDETVAVLLVVVVATVFLIAWRRSGEN
jgi:hypothetical protein